MPNFHDPSPGSSDPLLDRVRRALAAEFTIHEEVGRGGMATVYWAARHSDSQVVAIKILHPQLREVLGQSRFVREVAILSRLEHPAILPVLGSGDSDGFLYYVMPFVAGESLRDHLRREPHLPIEQAVEIVVTILGALKYAHDENVIHRDIKPENILLAGGRPLVADFGIARAIVRSGSDTMSSTGLAIGTPSYMSPEQGAGDAHLDGRTDIYSVGCMLYEMLAGSPPFGGSTPQAIRARHAHEAPPPLRVVRPSVPDFVEAAIAKALAKVPSDRFRTAAEFAEALHGPSRKAIAAPARIRGRIAWVGIGGVALAVIAGRLLRNRTPEQQPNANRYVILPFRGRDAAVVGLDGGRAGRLTWQGLGRWRDLDLVDELLVEDRLREVSSTDLTLTKGADLARDLGAGRLIWGEISSSADSVIVQSTLFDVTRRRPEPIRRSRVTYPLAHPAVVPAFLDLTQQLVAPASNDGSGQLASATPFYGALLATLAGDSALSNWNLDLALERYRAAAIIDSNYSPPRLRFARVAFWSERNVDEWLSAAEAARAAPTQLTWSELLEAEALVALGKRDYVTACNRFKRIVTRDSLKVAGWLGLGECLTLDDAVVASESSPSGWRFRSSYAAGIDALARALTLVPSAYRAFGGAPLRRLSAKLMAEPDVLRGGVSLTVPSRRFAAYPGLEADTLTFVPYPLEDAIAGTRVPTTWSAALAASRRKLLTITAAWLARFPASPLALSAHARALELAGRLDGPPGETSALSTVRGLRQTPLGKADPLLAAAEARLLIKTRRYTAARGVAEAALTMAPRNSEEGIILAGLAALIGDLHRSAALLAEFGGASFASPRGEWVAVPEELGSAAHRLAVYAGFGRPRDSIVTISNGLREAVNSRLEPARRGPVRDALLLGPSILAFPTLPPPAVEEFPIVAIERAVAAGDFAGARLRLEALAKSRPAELDATVAPDYALLEARLWASVGDTLAARHRLEVMFDEPGQLSIDLLSQVSQAAAVGRMMAFYAELGRTGRRAGLDSALRALWGAGRPLP